MKNRKRIEALNSFLVMCMASSLHASNLQENRPNVIFILADDLGFGDLACHGNPVVQTPNIDWLSSVSMNFTNYHTSPYSTPTRAAIMTGLYSHRTGARMTTTSRSFVHSDLLTLGDYFKFSGYNTALFGKWHIGEGSRYKPGDRGFEEVLSIDGGGPGTTTSPWKGVKYDDWMYHNGVLKQYKGYLTDILFTEAMSYLRNREKKKPFFLALPTFAPHRPWNVPREWVAQYRDKEGVSVELAYFFTAISRLDYNIGKLITFLKENNMYENTIFIFSSDNGTGGGSEFFNAGHRGKKGSFLEHGHREPLFIHWPAKGIDKKSESFVLTADIDLLPTFIDLCDLKSPREDYVLDGKSFADLILKKKDPEFWNSRIHIMETPAGGLENFEKNRSVIMKGPWRLIDKNNLTNIKTDPYQKENVYNEHPEIVEEMLTAYKEYWKSVSTSDKKQQPIYLGEDNSFISITETDSFINFWQQEHVLNALKMFGNWNVEFTKSGIYEFDFRRWPKELNKGLTQSVIVKPELKVSLYDLPVYLNSFGNDRNQTEKSTQLPIVGVILKINEKEYFVKNENNMAKIKIPVERGTADLKAVFVDKNKKPITNVYYIYVSKAL